LRDEARAAMEPWLAAANPSSLHAEGRAARAAIDAARASLAAILDVRPREVTFTSGGTEAVSAVLFGLARAASGPQRLMTTAAEHACVLAAAAALEAEGWEVERLPVDGEGRLAPGRLAAALERPAALVSVMLANNETGTLNPVAALAALARERGALFHCDAVQGPGLVPVDMPSLGADAVSFAAHKFGGPQGCGIAVVREGLPFTPPASGSQEHGRRPGSENVAAIAGAAAALERAERERPVEAPRLAVLRDGFERRAARDIPGTRINGAGAARVPSISSISFQGAERAALLVALDWAGVAASTGSACAAGSPEPSHVLAAMGVPAWAQHGVMRFSFGHTTTEEDAARVLRMLPSIAGMLRSSASVGVGS
jgi:cysteine desulfurase